MKITFFEVQVNFMALPCQKKLRQPQAHNQLGTPGETEKGLKVLNYVKHVFPEGAKRFKGEVHPLALPLVTGLCNHVLQSGIPSVKRARAEIPRYKASCLNHTA